MRLLLAMDGCSDFLCVVKAHQLWQALLRVQAPEARKFEEHISRLAKKYFGNSDLGFRKAFLNRFA